ncbi:hypothetical protein Droror1_Dr00016408, partial [Drosera rotundifolia]
MTVEQVEEDDDGVGAGGRGGDDDEDEEEDEGEFSGFYYGYGALGKPGMSRDDLFNINAGIVKSLCIAISKYAPNDISNREGLALEGDWYHKCYSL